MNVRPGIAATFALGFFVAACGGKAATSATCHFNSSNWRDSASSAGAPGHLTKRQHMADALLRCKLLEGKAKPQVRALLGSPSYRGAPTRWYFDVGPDREIGLDREQLFIQFDARDRVRKAELVDF